jgi:molybdopterin-biosynthesis enzyme MoeA-like protein
VAFVAELIAVGSELLRYGRHDGNGDWLQEKLARLGVEVLGRALVDA